MGKIARLCAAIALFTLPGACVVFSVPGAALLVPQHPARMALGPNRFSTCREKRGVGGFRAALDGYDSLLTLDSPAAWAAFILWSVPLPTTIGALLRYGEQVSGEKPVTHLFAYQIHGTLAIC